MVLFVGTRLIASLQTKPPQVVASPATTTQCFTKIFHELLDGTKDVVHLKYEEYMPILGGNPVFMIILYEMMYRLIEFKII